jgi:hypothetical protein
LEFKLQAVVVGDLEVKVAVCLLIKMGPVEGEDLISQEGPDLGLLGERGVEAHSRPVEREVTDRLNQVLGGFAPLLQVREMGAAIPLSPHLQVNNLGEAVVMTE